MDAARPETAKEIEKEYPDWLNTEQLKNKFKKQQMVTAKHLRKYLRYHLLSPSLTESPF